MSRRPPRPAAPILAALPWAVGLAMFILVLVGLRAVRPRPLALGEYLAGDRLLTRHTEAVERAWIDRSMTESYVPSPPGPPPCPEGLQGGGAGERHQVASALTSNQKLQELSALVARDPESWLPLLALSDLLLAQDRADLALPLLERYLERPQFTSVLREILDAAGSARPSAGPSSERVLAAIHLLQADGYARILENRTGSELWRSLKNPIGCSKLLGLRGELGTYSGASTTRGLLLPAPGCSPSEESLSTYDLYNNLIVGYMKTRDFHESEGRQKRELARPYRDSPAENPPLAVLELLAQQWQPAREYRVWALSNAERLLRERKWEGGQAPPDARLALSLAELLESVLPLAPEAAKPALSAEISEMVAEASRLRKTILPRRRAAYDPALVRMALIDGVRQGVPPELPSEAVGTLAAPQAATAGAVLSALGLRKAPASWLEVVRDGEAQAVVALGEGRGAWLAAGREDLAASVAVRGKGAETAERKEWARRARSLLRLGDRRPEELAEIEKGLGVAWRFSPTWILTTLPAASVLAGFVAGVAWITGWLLALQLRRRKCLFTSFYRLEALQKLRESR